MMSRNDVMYILVGFLFVLSVFGVAQLSVIFHEILHTKDNKLDSEAICFNFNNDSIAFVANKDWLNENDAAIESFNEKHFVIYFFHGMFFASLIIILLIIVFLLGKFVLEKKVNEE